MDNQKRRNNQENVRQRYKTSTKADIKTRQEAEDKKKLKQAKKQSKQKKPIRRKSIFGFIVPFVFISLVPL